MSAVKNKKRKRALLYFRYWLGIIFFVIFLFTVIRTFLFQTITIHNTAMSPTLKPGDLALINKYSFGARLPITILSLPFAPLRISITDHKYYFKIFSLPYHRMPGIQNLKNNSLIAFNYPFENDVPVDKKIVYVKRCVGLPGDTLEIKDSQLFINQTPVILSQEKHLYKVIIKTHKFPENLIIKYDLEEGWAHNWKEIFYFYLTQEQVNNLKKEKTILSIERDQLPEYKKKGVVYPHNELLIWNHYNYGPFIVPYAGMKIKVNLRNMLIYGTLLENFEKVDVSVKDDIFINKSKIEEYTFKNNYYFMLDDNRDNAKDSRHFGPIPETHIIGQITHILFSLNIQSYTKNFIRWDRTLKKIN